MVSEGTRTAPAHANCTEPGCDREASAGDERCELHASRLGRRPRGSRPSAPGPTAPSQASAEAKPAPVAPVALPAVVHEPVVALARPAAPGARRRLWQAGVTLPLALAGFGWLLSEPSWGSAIAVAATVLLGPVGAVAAFLGVRAARAPTERKIAWTLCVLGLLAAFGVGMSLEMIWDFVQHSPYKV